MKEKSTPRAIGGGQGHRGEAVEDGLGVEDRGVAVDALLQGADDGHGPDAVDERGGDQPVGEFGVVGLDEPLEAVAKAGEQGVERAAARREMPPSRMAKMTMRMFSTLRGHLDADEQHAQAEPLKDDGADALGKARLEPAADEAAADDGRGIDDGTKREHWARPCSCLADRSRRSGATTKRSA